MFGTPSRTGAAHVVELRPVRINQGFEDIVEERADLGGNPSSLTPGGTPANSGRCPDHQARPAVTGSFTQIGHRAQPGSSRSGRSVGLNLRKARPSAKPSKTSHRTRAARQM